MLNMDMVEQAECTFADDVMIFGKKQSKTTRQLVKGKDKINM